MSRATLIVNPHAGSKRDLATIFPAMIRQLAAQGIAADLVETTGPNSAGLLSAKAVDTGVDTVFACGGDGTVHEVLQGLVGSQTSLGIIPTGTANVLARNLGLSTDPLRALAQQANASAERIAIGSASYSADEHANVFRNRYFTVLAGAGPDGALIYSLLTGQKAAMGRTAYYVHAARLFVMRNFDPFRILYRLEGSGRWQQDQAVSVMCARVGDLGGVFSRLTRGNSLHSSSLRLSFLHPPAKLSLPSWFISRQLGMHGINPWLKTVDVDEFRCEPVGASSSVHAQVDGEWIGRLPISVSIVPDALSLLIPSTTGRCTFG